MATRGAAACSGRRSGSLQIREEEEGRRPVDGEKGFGVLWGRAWCEERERGGLEASLPVEVASARSQAASDLLRGEGWKTTRWGVGWAVFCLVGPEASRGGLGLGFSILFFLPSLFFLHSSFNAVVCCFEFTLWVGFTT